MDRTRQAIVVLGCLVALAGCHDTAAPLVGEDAVASKGKDRKTPPPPPSTDLIALGKHLFEDIDLSVNRNQSCRTCHEPGEGFAAALPGVTTRGSVVEGSVPGRFGDRKPPSAAYVGLVPNFSGGRNPTGGLFWDGRATGEILGTAIADQALGPFLNPMEQALPDTACVAYRVARSSYLALYTAEFGNDVLSIVWPSDAESVCTNPDLPVGHHVGLSAVDRATTTTVFHRAGLAVAAFEASPEVSPFNSRYDADDFTALEEWGEKLFDSKGKCHQCHEHKGDRPLFTDFAYHNLGVPKNPDHPVYHLGTTAFDPGLGGFTTDSRHMGKFRTPTLRNVAKGENRTFMHNGALISLEQVVDFYSTRDALPTCTDPEQLADPRRWGSVAFGGDGCWPPPEHDRNLDTKNMGKLGLTEDEVRAIVAYMRTLNDR
jgi:cytochrome c peroxidase